MSEIRVVLFSSAACLALAVWLTVNNELQRRAVPAAPENGATEVERLYKEMRGRLEEVRVEVAQLEKLRVALESKSYEPAARESVGDQRSEPLDGAKLRSELEAMHMAIQSIADAHANAEAGYQSHNLAEIRQRFPVTNWDACSLVMRQAMAEPGAAEVSYFDGGKSATLHSLLMLRPKDVLERFGAPSETKMDEGHFYWVYQSPTVGADRRPEPCLQFTFAKGYVWDVFFNLP